MTDAIEAFSIDIAEAELDDLRQRLARVRWPDEETPSTEGEMSWEQGTPLRYARALTEYWREHYDWRRAESLLNGFPQFTTALDGPGGPLDIHFIHVRSPHEGAMPETNKEKATSQTEPAPARRVRPESLKHNAKLILGHLKRFARGQVCPLALTPRRQLNTIRNWL